MPTAPINTEQVSARLRAKAIDLPRTRLLISRLAGSGLEPDLTVPINCEGFGRVRHFRRMVAAGWPANELPIAPACKALGIAPCPDVIRAQVFQNAACNWRCWYCFVPFDLLNADSQRSAWMTPTELVTLYRSEPDPPAILDLSGGSPDLVPEWVPWMMRALREAGLDRSIYLWSDDNLSTTYLFDYLSTEDLALLRSYPNYGRVCCFKGYDRASFAFNTSAAVEDFDRQFEIMARLLTLGIDVYGYVTLTGPSDNGIEQSIASFVDRLQALDPFLPLRVVPLQVQRFSPVEGRMTTDRVRSLAVQETAIVCWNLQMLSRFSATLRQLSIADVPLGSERQS